MQPTRSTCKGSPLPSQVPREEADPDVAQILRHCLGLPEAEMALALLLLNALGKETEDPLLASREIPVRQVLADAAVMQSIEKPHDGIELYLSDAMRRLGGTPIGRIIKLDGPRAAFARSPLFEIVEIRANVPEATPESNLVGWTVRCGQWAYWLLDRKSRMALCQAAAVYEVAGSRLEKRIALRAAFSVINRKIDIDESGKVFLNDLVPMIQKAIPSSVNGHEMADLVAKTVDALKHAGLVTEVRSGPSASRWSVLGLLGG